jgi:hypothetical protein
MLVVGAPSTSGRLVTGQSINEIKEPINVTLLFEYASLALELWFTRDHRIEELDLGKEKSLRFQLKGHAVPDIVDELFEAEKFDAAK